MARFPSRCELSTYRLCCQPLEHLSRLLVINSGKSTFIHGEEYAGGGGEIGRKAVIKKIFRQNGEFFR